MKSSNETSRLLHVAFCDKIQVWRCWSKIHRTRRTGEWYHPSYDSNLFQTGEGFWI